MEPRGDRVGRPFLIINLARSGTGLYPPARTAAQNRSSENDSPLNKA